MFKYVLLYTLIIPDEDAIKIQCNSSLRYIQFLERNIYIEEKIYGPDSVSVITLKKLLLDELRRKEALC